MQWIGPPKIDFIGDDFNRHQMSFSRYAASAAATVLTTFIWELIARKKSSQKKPSVAIAWCATQSKYGWSRLGRGFGWLSSYLTIVDLHDVWGTVEDLVRPTWNLIVSPFAFFSGYWQTAQKYKYPILVCLGSLLLVGSSVYLGPKFGLTRYLPSFRVITKFLVK
jgi:hypothetical protein